MLNKLKSRKLWMAAAAFLGAVQVPNPFHRSIIQGAIAAIYILSEAHVDAKAATPPPEPNEPEVSTNAIGFSHEPQEQPDTE